MKKILTISELYFDTQNATKRLVYIYGLLACLSIIVFYFFNFSSDKILYSHRWPSFIALIYSMVIAFSFHILAHWASFPRKAIGYCDKDYDSLGYQQAEAGNKGQIICELIFAIVFTVITYSISSFITNRFFNPIDFYFDSNNFSEGVFIKKIDDDSYDYVEILVKNDGRYENYCPPIVAISDVAMGIKYKNLIGTRYCLDTRYPITPGFEQDIIDTESGVSYNIVRKHHYFYYNND